MSTQDFIQSSQESEYTPLDPSTSPAEKLLANITHRTTSPATGPVDYTTDSPLNGDI